MGQSSAGAGGSVDLGGGKRAPPVLAELCSPTGGLAAVAWHARCVRPPPCQARQRICAGYAVDDMGGTCGIASAALCTMQKPTLRTDRTDGRLLLNF